jgi:chromosome segregation ATPase
MADEGLKVKISGDSSQLQAEMKKGSQSVEQFGQDIEKVAKVAAAAGAAILAGLGAATKEAIDIESTTIAFENLTSSVGQSSGEILDALQKASAGTVAANDLMLSSNRAMVLGVADNTEEFTTLMEIARDRARAMGMTTTQAFNDIVTGIGRGSPLILDNLGLVIDQVAANEEYARSLGKTADALTEEERKQALLTAVLEQGKKTIDKNAQSQMTAAEKTQALKASVSDITAEIGGSFLPIVQDASDEIIKIIENIQDWRQENPLLSESLDKAVLATRGMLIAGGSLLIILPKIRKGIDTVRDSWLALKKTLFTTNPYVLAAVAAIALIVGVVATAKWKIDELTEAERRNKAMVEDLNKSIKIYTDQIAENEEQLKIETKTLETYQDNLAKAEKQLADLTAERDKALDSMNNASTTIEQLNQLYDQSAEAINKAQEEVNTWTSMVDYQQGIVDDLTASLESANDKLEAAQDEYDKATDKVNEYSSALSNLERQINGLSRVRIEGMGEYEDKINAVESEINKTKLAIWEAEQEGQNTTALEAKLAELENQLEGLNLEYDAAYSDALYQQSKAAEEALGQDREMSIDDILDQLGVLGEDRAQMEDLLNDALADQETAGQGVDEAQAAVDTATATLEAAQSTLDLYTGYLETAQENLELIEGYATNTFNSIMGIADGQSAIT